MPDTPLLKVERLTVSFGENEVVHGVDFDLLQGEILAIVGESGSGKSVTCSAIAGLLPRGGTSPKAAALTGPPVHLGPRPIRPPKPHWDAA